MDRFHGDRQSAWTVAEHRIVHAIQLVAALMTLIAALALMRNKDYLTAAIMPATLACSYMLLFNPRAEINTYVMMAVPYSLLAAYFLCATQRVLSGLALGLACVALGTGALGTPVMDIFDPWSKPILLLFCIGVCCFSLLRGNGDDADPNRSNRRLTAARQPGDDLVAIRSLRARPGSPMAPSSRPPAAGVRTVGPPLKGIACHEGADRPSVRVRTDMRRGVE